MIGFIVAILSRLIAFYGATRSFLQPSYFHTESRFIIALPFLLSTIVNVMLGIMVPELLKWELGMTATEAVYGLALLFTEGNEWADWFLAPYEVAEIDLDKEASYLRHKLIAIQAEASLAGGANRAGQQPANLVMADGSVQVLMSDPVGLRTVERPVYAKRPAQAVIKV